MRKNKWILGILLVGLLLCGIGGGMMFVEFSGLSYAGEYVFETDTPETRTMEVSLADCPQGPVYVDCPYYPVYPLADRLVVDETMEEGLIRIETTFDPEQTVPSVYLERGEAIDPQDGEQVRLWIGYYSGFDDLDLFFRAKDMILRDLKNNTLRSYRTVEVMDLTITVAPETAKRLIF